MIFTAQANNAATIEAAIGDAASASAAGAYINYNGTKVVLVSGDTGEALGSAAGTNFGLHVKHHAVKDRANLVSYIPAVEDWLESSSLCPQ